MVHFIGEDNTVFHALTWPAMLLATHDSDSIQGNAGEWATDLDGKPVLCGGTHLDGVAGIIPGMRRRWTPKWQETDPQIPKSRWWLADGKFVGFRLVCED